MTDAAHDIDTLTPERIHSIAEKLFSPRRSQLVRCLAQVTTASEKAVAEALVIDPVDKLKAARQLVQTSDGAWPGVASGREAWETIAPVEWVGATHRRFERGGEAPASVGDAVALASDPEGVSAAEALVRQFASMADRALSLEIPTETVGWRIVDPRRFRARFCARSTGKTGDALFRAWCTKHKLAPKDLQNTTISADLVLPLQALQAAIIRQWGPVAWDVVALLKWHDMTSVLRIPSPFAPLIALWESGYGFDELVDGRAILVAPTV